MHIRLCVLFLLIPFSLAASQASVCTSVDLRSLESLVLDTAQVRIEATVTLTGEFSLSIPVSLVAERHRGAVQCWETGLFLQYHPLSYDLFISLSLMQVALLANHPYEEGPQFLFLNEMAVGWQFSVPPSIVIKPCLVIKDPHKVFVQEYEELGALFSQFPMVRFALLVGWKFPVPSSKKAEQ